MNIERIKEAGEIDGWQIVVLTNDYGEYYALAVDDTGVERHLRVETHRCNESVYDWLGGWPNHQFPLTALARLASRGWLRVENTILLPGGSSLGSVFC